MSSAEAEQPTIAETIPVVSMGISLGSRLEPGAVLDFDYGAYVAYCRERGMSDRDIAATTIEIGQPPRTALTPEAAYDDKTGTISTSLAASNISDINRLLAHETEHRIDHAQGRYGLIERAMTLATGYSHLVGASGLALSCLSAFSILVVASEATLALATFGAGLVFAAGTIAVAIAAHRLNPMERRARLAEQQEHRFVAITEPPEEDNCA